jgi:hypothetical protein
MSTGRFAGASGEFSIQNELFNDKTMTFNEKFTVKLVSSNSDALSLNTGASLGLVQ